MIIRIKTNNEDYHINTASISCMLTSGCETLKDYEIRLACGEAIFISEEDYERVLDLWKRDWSRK